MDLCSKKIPIRYSKLQARLFLLVWKEWYSSRSLSSGEGSCHERRMHGTRPSFYGNKRNLKEELGVERGMREKDEEEDVLECFWRYMIMKGGIWNAANLGISMGSQLFIHQSYAWDNSPHSCSLWLLSYPNNISKYLQSRCGPNLLQLMF